MPPSVGGIAARIAQRLSCQTGLTAVGPARDTRRTGVPASARISRNQQAPVGGRPEAPFAAFYRRIQGDVPRAGAPAPLLPLDDGFAARAALVEIALLVMPGGALGGIDLAVVVDVDTIEALAIAGRGRLRAGRQANRNRLSAVRPGTLFRAQVGGREPRGEAGLLLLVELIPPIAVLVKGDCFRSLSRDAAAISASAARPAEARLAAAMREAARSVQRMGVSPDRV